MSHDLRTPLAGIKAAVSSLRQHDVAFSPEDEASLLETIEESADRLTGLVANLLDMSRLQSGSVTARRDPVDLADAVGIAVDSLAEGDRVRVRIEDGTPPVEADPGLLDRVLANVLENALRHSPGRQEVVVRAAATQDTFRCGSSTVALVCPTLPRSSSSPPSSGTATHPGARASGSGWRWRRGSSRR